MDSGALSDKSAYDNSSVHLEIDFPFADIFWTFDSGAATETACEIGLDRVLERQGKINIYQ